LEMVWSALIARGAVSPPGYLLRQLSHGSGEPS